jgi:hypothetical protein
MLELEMFSKMFAVLFTATLSVIADREKRTERFDWEEDDGGVKKIGRKGSLRFERKFSG